MGVDILVHSSNSHAVQWMLQVLVQIMSKHFIKKVTQFVVVLSQCYDMGDGGPEGGRMGGQGKRGVCGRVGGQGKREWVGGCVGRGRRSVGSGMHGRREGGVGGGVCTQ